MSANCGPPLSVPHTGEMIWYIRRTLSGTHAFKVKLFSTSTLREMIWYRWELNTCVQIETIFDINTKRDD